MRDEQGGENEVRKAADNLGVQNGQASLVDRPLVVKNDRWWRKNRKKEKFWCGVASPTKKMWKPPHSHTAVNGVSCCVEACWKVFCLFVQLQQGMRHPHHGPTPLPHSPQPRYWNLTKSTIP
eukprot:g31873.t1